VVGFAFPITSDVARS